MAIYCLPLHQRKENKKSNELKRYEDEKDDIHGNDDDNSHLGQRNDIQRGTQRGALPHR